MIVESYATGQTPASLEVQPYALVTRGVCDRGHGPVLPKAALAVDLPTLPGLANELADLGSLGGDMEAALADITTTLDGPDKAEPSAPPMMMFSIDPELGVGTHMRYSVIAAI